MWMPRERNQQGKKGLAFRNVYRMQKLDRWQQNIARLYRGARPYICSDPDPDVWKHALHRKCQLCIEWGVRIVQE
jgi:hypothetical protein